MENSSQRFALVLVVLQPRNSQSRSRTPCFQHSDKAPREPEEGRKEKKVSSRARTTSRKEDRSSSHLESDTMSETMGELLFETLSSDHLTSSIIDLGSADSRLDDGVGSSLSLVDEIPNRTESGKRRGRED